MKERLASRCIARHTPTLWSQRMADATNSDVLRGTLDLLVLKTLSLEPLHGWGISQRIQELSRGVLDVNQGSLYPALQRLEHRGLITNRWEITENNRRARYYSLTRDGRRALADEQESWLRYTGAVGRILEAT
jgi:transcriptional regulator